MKKYSLYKWLRRMAMFSGITILAMMFACSKKYGPPDDMNWSQVLNKEIQEVSNDAPSLP
jgi:hypothetical protein